MKKLFVILMLTLAATAAAQTTPEAKCDAAVKAYQQKGISVDWRAYDNCVARETRLAPYRAYQKANAEACAKDEACAKIAEEVSPACENTLSKVCKTAIKAYEKANNAVCAKDEACAKAKAK